MRNFIAGCATVDMLVGDRIIATANTLVDSSININSSSEDVRGGIGNKLLGKYYHTSTMDINLTDVVFRLEYLAFQTGSNIEQISQIFASEQVTINSNQGIIVGDPDDYEDYGKIAWVTLPGEDSYETVELNGKQFTYEAADGQVVCVKYVRRDLGSKSIVVSSNFIPSEVKLVMRCNLYRAGANNAINDSSKVGELQIVVPRFQFNGAQELSLQSSGVCQVPIAGSALDNPSADCTEGGYYAIITETISGVKWYDNVITLAVEDSDVELEVNETKQLVVKAVPKSGSAFTVSASELTFTSGSDSIATVTDAGLVAAVAQGTTNITIAAKDKPELTAIAEVTVSNN